MNAREKGGVKAAFGYFGSKGRLSGKIVKELPPHGAWVELFCGSAAITLAKEPAPIEIINDRDEQVVNFFEQLRCNQEELCRLVALTPYARKEYEKARTRPTSSLDPLERARIFVVGTMMAINGTTSHPGAGFSFSDSYTRGKKEARVSRWYNLPERMASLVERLRDIRIENQDARVLMKAYLKRPATLLYLDPPYFSDRVHGYNVDAKDEEFHEELLSLCQGAGCMVLVSGYDSSLYSKYLSKKNGWTKMILNTTTRVTNGVDYPKQEVLWKNESFVRAKRTNEIPIIYTEQELKEKKLNPLR